MSQDALPTTVGAHDEIIKEDVRAVLTVDHECEAERAPRAKAR
jgi:hypothetical protein